MFIVVVASILIAALTCMCTTTFMTTSTNAQIVTFLNSKPLVLGCYFEVNENRHSSSTITRIRRLPVFDEDRYPSKRLVEWTEENEEFNTQLRDSKKYNKDKSETIRNEKCKLPYKWQSLYIPNCNSVHENDFTKFFVESSTSVDENIRMVASGFWRDVWKFPDKEESRTWVASKTLRYTHAYTERNFDRHRRDALATERTTSSPDTIDMYAFCGHTMFTEFAAEGSLSDLIWPLEGDGSKLSMRERLDFAMGVARGVKAAHFTERPDAASIVHADITPSQFLIANGSLKLVSESFMVYS